jgi:hypothetical protein
VTGRLSNRLRSDATNRQQEIIMAKTTTRTALATAILGTAGLFGGCASDRETEGDGSALRHMAFNAAARNVIILAGVGDYSAREGFSDLPGSAPDIERLTRLYRDEYRWEVLSLLDKTSAEVLAETQRAAELLQDDSTLHFHYEGHGSEEGMMIFGDRDVSFADVSRSIRAGRAGRVKRLLVTVDACYSGNAVDGRTQAPTNGNAASTFAEDEAQRRFVEGIWSANERSFTEMMSRHNGGGSDETNGDGSGGGDGTAPVRPGTSASGDVLVDGAVSGFKPAMTLALAGDDASQLDAVQEGAGATETPVFEQLVVIGSALRTQTAADWADDGGPFNVAWRAALAAAATQRTTARVSDFLEGLRRTTKRLTADTQEPVYRVEPSTAGADLLFGNQR